MDIRTAVAPRVADNRPRRPADNPSARFEVIWARHADEVRSAQRLRHRVFAGEMGAQLSPPPGTPPGLDVDRFDAYCEHLLVRLPETPHAPAEVIGTYRVLTPEAARRAGGLYSDTEFDLSALDAWRPRLAELGRSCTAPEWRQGGVILLLWSALAEFLQRRELDRVVGCASVSMQDGGHVAASLWARLQPAHLVEEALRVSPRLPLPVERLDSSLPVEAPPLIKGYLRCGAQLLGPPAWDPDFAVADLPMMMDLARLPAAYRSRFIKR